MNLTGRVLAHYRVGEEISRGGMGVIYRATDTRLNRDVALKVLPDDLTDDSGRRRRFIQEAQAASSLEHPHIAVIYEVNEADGHVFIAMELIRGETLRDLLARQRPPAARALELATEVAAGLALAHEKHIVHRDLKPANVMLTAEGHSKIIDFGLAKLIAAAPGDETRTDRHTEVGAVVGTTSYMSPEQARGGIVDHRSDVFSFGILLHEMLSGELPFQGKSRIETANAIINEPARRLPRTASVPAEAGYDLQRIVDKCLEKDPVDRYQGMKDVVVDLRAVRRRLESASQTVPVNISRGLIKRRTALGAGVAAIALLGAATGWWYFASRAPSTPAAQLPVSVLIADFDNRTGDATLDELTEQALAVGVQSARFIHLMDSREALRAAALLPGGTLNLQNARRLALDEGVDVVLTGEVEDGLSFHVRGLPGKLTDDRALFDIRRRAPSADAILTTLGALAAEVRSALGDTEARPSRVPPHEMLMFGSLDAARAYATAMDLLGREQPEAARHEFAKSAKLDPSSARAWMWLAVLGTNAGDGLPQGREQYEKAMERLSSVTERERFRIRGLYYILYGRTEEATREYEALLARFPGDPLALTNLAFSHFKDREFLRALELGQDVARLFSNSTGRRANAALYALYSGNYPVARSEAQRGLAINARSELLLLAFALSHAAMGEYGEARSIYQQLQTLSPTGRYRAALGEGDLELLLGHPTAAAARLELAVANEPAAGRKARLLLLLAEARLGQDRLADAAALAEAASQSSDTLPVQFLAGRLLIAAGRTEQATARAKTLAARSDSEARMAAKVLEGEILLAERDGAGAVERFKAAVSIADSWLARSGLGRAYLETGAFANAETEFDRCLKRRGETTAVFLDDVPTLRMVAPVYYYQGLARSALKTNTANESFKVFLAFKDGGDEKSALIDDARRRTR